jgi:diguanylate cyclase
MIGAAMILAIFDHYYARQEKKDQQYQETKRLAYTDSLTGMANFTAFSKQVAELENNWKNDIVVAILDLDHFKQINDTFGHLVGNEVLVLFTRNLQRILAKNISLDKFHLYRFGGEEFCAVFYDVSKEEVERSISNALDYFNEQPLILEDGRNISITFSGGITLRGTKDTTIKTTLNRADDSLYKAKKSGRNQLVVDC